MKHPPPSPFPTQKAEAKGAASSKAPVLRMSPSAVLGGLPGELFTYLASMPVTSLLFLSHVKHSSYKHSGSGSRVIGVELGIGRAYETVPAYGLGAARGPPSPARGSQGGARSVTADARPSPSLQEVPSHRFPLKILDGRRHAVSVHWWLREAQLACAPLST